MELPATSPTDQSDIGSPVNRPGPREVWGIPQARIRDGLISIMPGTAGNTQPRSSEATEWPALPTTTMAPTGGHNGPVYNPPFYANAWSTNCGTFHPGYINYPRHAVPKRLPAGEPNINALIPHQNGLIPLPTQLPTPWGRFDTGSTAPSPETILPNTKPTQLLSLECQKRGFNPKWAEEQIGENEYKCAVELNGALVKGSASYSTPEAAKLAVASVALGLVRRWPERRPTTDVPGGGDSRAAGPDGTEEWLTETLDVIQLRLGNLVPLEARSNPAAAKAFLAGFALGLRTAQSAQAAAVGSPSSTPEQRQHANESLPHSQP